MPDDARNVEIRMDRIPVGRGLAAAVVIVVLLGAMLLELPSLRLPALVGVVGGLIVGAVLILRHRRSR